VQVQVQERVGFAALGQGGRLPCLCRFQQQVVLGMGGDDVRGVVGARGEARRGARGVGDASVADLCTVEGISEELAQTIYNALR
jgi:hypothetical protein